MRRSGYNSLSSSREADEVDAVEMTREDDLEEANLFSEIRATDAKANKRTICLVFTLFFGGFVSILAE
jgi:hypothetical protein